MIDILNFEVIFLQHGIIKDDLSKFLIDISFLLLLENMRFILLKITEIIIIKYMIIL
jgi:hypothetical protein